ncbi:hypothetical protein EDB85DRAFT_2157620 [Lactarius pseudohatsudake]|nr:hypothetical protein EDB85DRAFT_2157620 [Lactarius pseudohatsudake]
MRDVADSVHAAATAKLNTPQVIAIKAIEKDEGLTRFELVSVVECVMGDAEFANAYLAGSTRVGKTRTGHGYAFAGYGSG